MDCGAVGLALHCTDAPALHCTPCSAACQHAPHTDLLMCICLQQLAGPVARHMTTPSDQGQHTPSPPVKGDFCYFAPRTPSRQHWHAPSLLLEAAAETRQRAVLDCEVHSSSCSSSTSAAAVLKNQLFAKHEPLCSHRLAVLCKWRVFSVSLRTCSSHGPKTQQRTDSVHSCNTAMACRLRVSHLQED